MIQQLLLYAYVFLGFFAFWYWISAVLAGFRMLKYRRNNHPLFMVSSSDTFNDDNFSEEGEYRKVQLLRSIRYFFYVVCGLFAVVFTGNQTQS